MTDHEKAQKAISKLYCGQSIKDGVPSVLLDLKYTKGGVLDVPLHELMEVMDYIKNYHYVPWISAFQRKRKEL